ncbi:DUF7689 domain-containing protein [Frateuria aurantia]|nr:hypothetical protein [Frateuria aurantia]
MGDWFDLAKEKGFPRLTKSSSRITSTETSRYNCLAWAANVENRWWWPYGDAWWPENVPRTLDIDSLKAAYRTVGFVDCNDGLLEADIEKIALYALNSEFTHAARQLPSGKWASKMGHSHDIEHDCVTTVEGGIYGECVAYMCRRRAID